mmetsp:Transcript_22790/g.31802  ORF Transcript_22790/g.31802 Transcript_22790/m.31802 type:complete len:123 (+) Transcript_22790:112-480(+)
MTLRRRTYVFPQRVHAIYKQSCNEMEEGMAFEMALFSFQQYDAPLPRAANLLVSLGSSDGKQSILFHARPPSHFRPNLSTRKKWQAMYKALPGTNHILSIAHHQRATNGDRNRPTNILLHKP